MGKTVTPKYALHIMFASGAHGLHTLVWDFGRATDANLAAWVAKFDASMAPGGWNAHLGPDTVSHASIALNYPGGRTVALYKAAA